MYPPGASEFVTPEKSKSKQQLGPVPLTVIFRTL
jgi:hypothetical protein